MSQQRPVVPPPLLPPWMFNYEAEVHEISRADDAPTSYRICKTCLCLIAPWYLQAHFEYHVNRGDIG